MTVRFLFIIICSKELFKEMLDCRSAATWTNVADKRNYYARDPDAVTSEKRNPFTDQFTFSFKNVCCEHDRRSKAEEEGKNYNGDSFGRFLSSLSRRSAWEVGRFISSRCKEKKKMINVRNDFIFVANVIKNTDQGIIFWKSEEETK